MQESVARSYEIEEAKGGLVVRKALYGRLIGSSRYCLDGCTVCCCMLVM